MVHKWRERPPTPRQRRRADIDAKVKASFEASGGTYGSPRVWEDLRDDGEAVTKKTVAASMARQGLRRTTDPATPATIVDQTGLVGGAVPRSGQPQVSRRAPE